MNNIIDIDNKKLEQEERIMRYLQGKMTSEEERLLMDELKKDTDFKARAINMARLAKGTQQVGEERDSILKEVLLASDELSIRKITRTATRHTDNLENSETMSLEGEARRNKVKVVSIKRKIATILSIAASLIFVVFFGFQYYDYSKTTSLGEEFASPYESSVARGDKNSSVEQEIHYLIDNVYQGKDLDKSLKRLAVLWEVSTLDTYNDYTDHASEIGWALATGYLKDNNKEDAKVVLEKLVAQTVSGNAINAKAIELLEKLK